MRASLTTLGVLAMACGQAGDPCTTDGDCAPSALVCYRATAADGTANAEGVCGYRRLGENQACQQTAECEATLFCSNDLPAEVRARFGTCIPRQPAGGACYRAENCVSGLRCQKPSGAQTGSCGA